MRYVSLSLAAVMLLGAGCNQSRSNHALNERFELAPGETTNVDQLRITMQNDIQDSRCASDVVCIRAGEVIIKLDVAENGKTARTLTLGVPKGTLASDEQTVGAYHIRLQDVTPYPKSTETKESRNYRAHIVVTQ